MVDADTAPDRDRLQGVPVGELDEARVEEFAGRLCELYEGSFLTYMIDIGCRTGLFEAAAEGPATSDTLASRAGLHERYVREWAAALVTGGILSYDAAAGTYRLPPERAACLTGDSSANLAPLSQVSAVLAPRLPDVVQAFRHGGGVPSSAYRPAFTDMMDAIMRGVYDELLVTDLLPLTGELATRMADGIRVADIGCGAGHPTNLLAQAHPASVFHGYDLAEDAIDKARAEAAALGSSNVTFEVADVATLPTEPGFDAVFAFDVLHDLAQPAAVLRTVHDALVPGGWLVLLDSKVSSNLEDNIGTPLCPWLYGISTLYCLTVSLAEGGAGLGTCWGEQLACRMLSEAGFVDTTVHDHPTSPVDGVYVSRRTA